VLDSVGIGIHHIPSIIILTGKTISKSMLPIKVTADWQPPHLPAVVHYSPVACCTKDYSMVTEVHVWTTSTVITWQWNGWVLNLKHLHHGSNATTITPPWVYADLWLKVIPGISFNLPYFLGMPHYLQGNLWRLLDWDFCTNWKPFQMPDTVTALTAVN